jgi:hypothetical protein
MATIIISIVELKMSLSAYGMDKTKMDWDFFWENLKNVTRKY